MATKKPWRGEPSSQRDVDPEQPTKAKHVVSLDQLVPLMPGLIAQMAAFITRKRFEDDTVNVDQFGSLGFLYLHTLHLNFSNKLFRAAGPGRWAHCIVNESWRC